MDEVIGFANASVKKASTGDSEEYFASGSDEVGGLIPRGHKLSDYVNDAKAGMYSGVTDQVRGAGGQSGYEGNRVAGV